MKPLELTGDEISLRDGLAELLSEIESKLLHASLETRESTFLTMAEKAYELHASLKNRGHEPQHTRGMLENRKWSDNAEPGTTEFYCHIHPVEDLLNWIDNPWESVDPVDCTMGDKFEIEVHSNRWNHKDIYSLKRTQTGWDVSGLRGTVASDRGGNPGVFELLEHDFIDYPHRLEERLESLWLNARDKGLSHEQVQEGLVALAEWINLVERNKPAKHPALRR